MSYSRKKTRRENNTFWFLTPKNLGKNEDQSPTQTATIGELNYMKKKLKPTDTAESRKKLAQRVEWTGTLLTQAEEQAAEDILVD